MTIIVLVGVQYGTSAMLATHENAGSIIFLGWIALFWYLMYRFVLKPSRDKEKAGDGVDELRCANCKFKVDPDHIPKKCPKCGQVFEQGIFCESCGTEIDVDNIPEKCPECGNPFDLAEK
jgi:rubrerythrin